MSLAIHADAIDDKKLKKAVEILKDEFQPSRLFLFGSRANDTATEESDYDFLMVVKEWSPDLQLKHMRRARQLLAAQDIDADVFVYAESDFEKCRLEFSTIPEIATTTGREINLYEDAVSLAKSTCAKIIGVI